MAAGCYHVCAALTGGAKANSGAAGCRDGVLQCGAAQPRGCRPPPCLPSLAGRAGARLPPLSVAPVRAMLREWGYMRRALGPAGAGGLSGGRGSPSAGAARLRWRCAARSLHPRDCLSSCHRCSPNLHFQPFYRASAAYRDARRRSFCLSRFILVRAPLDALPVREPCKPQPGHSPRWLAEEESSSRHRNDDHATPRRPLHVIAAV